MIGDAGHDHPASLSKRRSDPLSGATLATLLAAFLMVPFLPGQFWTHVANEILLMGLFAMSFNLIYGYMGQISFGHAAFFGLGAYTTAMLMPALTPANGDIGYAGFALAVAAAVPTAAAGAAIIGYFCVRLIGIYFAVLSMAFGELLHFMVFSSYDITGGDNGIQGLMPPGALRDPATYYYMTLAVVTVAVLLLWRITQSPYGYILRAIRDNQHRTRFLGVNVRLHMWINFVLAASFAGLAGALWGPLARSVSPNLLGWQESGNAVIVTLIGGSAFLAGPMVGAIIYTVLHAWVSSVTEYWPLTIGSIVLAIVIFAPGGALGWVGVPLRLLRTRRDRRPDPGAAAAKLSAGS